MARSPEEGRSVSNVRQTRRSESSARELGTDYDGEASEQFAEMDEHRGGWPSVSVGRGHNQDIRGDVSDTSNKLRQTPGNGAKVGD